MAERHPPSPMREDGILSLGRLRVKPAMTVRGWGKSFWLKSRVPSHENHTLKNKYLTS